MAINEVIQDNNEIHNLLKKALKSLNLKDPKVNELIEKEKWNDIDRVSAYTILRPYKKEKDIKDILDEINDLNKKDIKAKKNLIIEERKEEKKNEILEGRWIPIQFKNNYPVMYAGWNEGKPYIQKITMSKEGLPITILQKITLRNFEEDNIEKSIKRIKIDGTDMVEFKGEVFTKTDFVNLMVYPSFVNYFTECINALSIDNKEYKEPKFYVENGIIKFPENYYARRDDAYQRILKDALNIGKVDPEIYHEAVELMLKHPKQLAFHYGMIGANIINVIDYEDYFYTIDAIGESDSGKSFVAEVTLMLCYGVFNAKMQDDAVSSAFRHLSIANSTNIITYIEEALLNKTSQTRLKSKGKNVRGNANKSLTMYDINTTFVFSRNTESDDVKNIDPDEKKAQNKRILKFIFEADDVIKDNTEKVKGADFLKKIKKMAGGLLYEKLKNKPISAIEEKYREIKEKETKPEVIVSLLGAWIMDNADFIPVVTEVKEPTILDEFFSKIIDSWYRINSTPYDETGKRRLSYEDNLMETNLMIDDKKHSFKLSATGFNQIKKTFGYNGHASDFAKSFNFEYKNTKIFNILFKSITGKIPHEFFESEINNENVEDEITDDEIKNKKIMDDLGL